MMSKMTNWFTKTETKTKNKNVKTQNNHEKKPFAQQGDEHENKNDNINDYK